MNKKPASSDAAFEEWTQAREEVLGRLHSWNSQLANAVQLGAISHHTPYERVLLPGVATGMSAGLFRTRATDLSEAINKLFAGIFGSLEQVDPMDRAAFNAAVELRSKHFPAATQLLLMVKGDYCEGVTAEGMMTAGRTVRAELMGKSRSDIAAASHSMNEGLQPATDEDPFEVDPSPQARTSTVKQAVSDHVHRYPSRKPILEACESFLEAHKHWAWQWRDADPNAEVCPLDGRGEAATGPEVIDHRDRVLEALTRMIDEVNAFGSDVSFSAAFRFASCFDSPTPNIKMTVAELLQAGREARAEAMQWASRAKRENTRGNLVPTQDDHRITFQQAIEGVPELGLTPIPHATLRAWQRDPQVASDLGVNKDGKPQLQRFRVSVLLQLNENRQRKRTRQPQRGRPVSDQATPRKTRKNGKERELRS